MRIRSQNLNQKIKSQTSLTMSILILSSISLSLHPISLNSYRSPLNGIIETMATDTPFLQAALSILLPSPCLGSENVIDRA